MDKTIAVDIDDSIWRSLPEILKRVEDMTGDCIPYDEYTDYDLLFDRYGEVLSADIFTSVCADPCMVSNRILFPNVIEAIEEIKEDYKVIFATHNPRPETMYRPLKDWLDSLFGESHLLMVPCTQSKVEVLDMFGCEAIIDDKPKTLLSAFDAGYDTYAPILPFNQGVVEMGKAVGFNDWSEMPAMLMGERV